MTEFPFPRRRRHTTSRRPFTSEEDAHMIRVIQTLDCLNWDYVATQMPGRSSRQCRERWVNYLSPFIRHDPWDDAEDQKLVEKVNEVGHSWSTIGKFFNGRSESDVKNRWYSHLKLKTTLSDGKYRLLTPEELLSLKKTQLPIITNNTVNLESANKTANPVTTAGKEKQIQNSDVLNVDTETNDIWSWIEDDRQIRWDII